MSGSNIKWRTTVIALVFLFAVITMLPNFGLTPDNWFLGNKKIVRGLDLQGGLHIVMGVDVNTVIKEQAARSAESFMDYFKDKKLTVTSVKSEAVENRHEIVVEVSDTSKIDEVKSQLAKDWPNFIAIASEGNQVRVVQNELGLKDLKSRTIQQAIETLRNRIDEFGVSEPNIAAQGDDRILVQLPGVQDSERAKKLINTTARLDFMLVSEGVAYDELNKWIKDAETAGGFDINKVSIREYTTKINEALKGKLKEKQLVLFGRAENAEDLTAGKVPYVLEKVGVGGDDLRDAFITYGEFGDPAVSIVFTPVGAGKFASVTGENVGRNLAIVLDDVVYSAPNIRSKIADGRGEITLGGGRDYNSMMDEAKTISMVLRAGALPARLEQLEERTVGPSLGADSIAHGKMAVGIGSLLVFLFMLFYYKGFGLIANLALGFNVFLIFAALTSLEATLTLPGIAGIALTIGMAVDANVIIFERIKEELAKGAHVLAAIREGFEKAYSAIFDANITTAATSVILMYFGTGPVRGFAVTLLIGIITSMFTAVFVTKVALDIVVGRMKYEKLAIR